MAAWRRSRLLVAWRCREGRGVVLVFNMAHGEPDGPHLQPHLPAAERGRLGGARRSPAELLLRLADARHLVTDTNLKAV